jgi:fatty-acid desaturase
LGSQKPLANTKLLQKMPWVGWYFGADFERIKVHVSNSTSKTEIKPWERSIFYAAPGERLTQFWIVLIHLSGLIGLIFLPLPSIWVVLAALILMMLGAQGTTIAYHRALTHHGVELHPVVEKILIFFAVFNGSGTPLTWVPNHRRHHATADTPDDVSSPHHGGFWWSHLRWLYQVEQSPPERYSPDLKISKYAIWNKLQVPITFVSFFFGLIWGGAAWLWLGPIRLLLALHAQCTVNSICHLGDAEGQNARRGSSINVWWLTPLHLGHGENWHGNHHEDQSNPRLGQGFWQIDLAWLLILGLKQVGLVSRIRRNTGPATTTPTTVPAESTAH